jgi:hypothetical protein
MIQAASATTEIRLFEQYGPLIGGADLARVAGFRTVEAFKSAARRGRVGFKVFAIPGRQGRFASTADVAAWLETIVGH